jgi:hypothetical protein
LPECAYELYKDDLARLTRNETYDGDDLEDAECQVDRQKLRDLLMENDVTERQVGLEFERLQLGNVTAYHQRKKGNRINGTVTDAV